MQSGGMSCSSLYHLIRLLRADQQSGDSPLHDGPLRLAATDPARSTQAQSPNFSSLAMTKHAGEFDKPNPFIPSLSPISLTADLLTVTSVISMAILAVSACLVQHFIGSSSW